MDEPAVPVSLALNQVQSWLNAGETEKAIQGCQEVLNMEPGNTRALVLLRQAYDLAATQKPQVTPMNPIESSGDPLQALQVEEKPAETAPTQAPAAPQAPVLTEEDDLFEAPKINFQLIAAILIPAVIALGVAAIFALKILEKKGPVVDGHTLILESSDHLEANETRVKDLQALNTAIENFYNENEAYPTSTQLEELIQADSKLKKLEDPRHGDIDKAGETYAYIYRVYQTAEGPNSAYALTALFEDSQGFGTEWGYGNGLDASENPRDLKFAVVIGPELTKTDEKKPTETEARPDGPKVKPQGE
jgi:hypothetical protein